MNRIRPLLLAIYLASGLVALPLAAAELGDSEQTRKALDKVVERLNALDRWITDAEKQRLRWEKDVQEKDQEVADVARTVENTVAALKRIENE